LVTSLALILGYGIGAGMIRDLKKDVEDIKKGIEDDIEEDK
jgi:hypothetical protein